MTNLQFTHKKLTEVTDKAQKNKLLAEWCSRRKKKNTGNNGLHGQRQKKLFVSEKVLSPRPPPPKKNNGPDSLSPDNYYSYYTSKRAGWIWDGHSRLLILYLKKRKRVINYMQSCVWVQWNRHSEAEISWTRRAGKEENKNRLRALP